MQVFACCDAEDSKKNFYDSEMNQLIDQYTNSILLNVTIPPPPRRKTIVADEGMVRVVRGGRGGGRDMNRGEGMVSESVSKGGN